MENKDERKNGMNVALIHDYLIEYGGAERVLEELMRLFPEAPIYTLLYDERRTFGRFAGRVAGTSLFDVGFVRRHHRLFIPFMPAAAELMRIPEQYDVVISDSAGFAKGIRHAPHAFHLSYCHTPLRYAWETDQYFSNRLFTSVFRPAFSYMRHWDFQAAQRPRRILANSAFIAGKIRTYYRREAAVVHPPVDETLFFYDPSLEPAEYFLAAGRLLHYKRFDLVIDAFKFLGLPLKVVGSGAMEEGLKARARGYSNIEFMPFVKDVDVLRRLYAGAQAFVFPHVEDFGLVAVEAQACGTPVVALRAGGVEEIVRDKETGLFFNEPTVAALAATVGQFRAMQFDRAFISRMAERFGRGRFRERILAELREGLQGGA